MQRYFAYARIPSTGAPASGATVDVFWAGTTTAATIYSNKGITTKSNPFTADSDGFFFFYAANGRYDVRLSSGGIPSAYTWSDIVLFDPASPSQAVLVNRTGVDGFRAGEYTYLREPDSTAAMQKMVPSISGPGTVLAYNATWNANAGEWYFVAPSRANAIVMSEGSTWIVSSANGPVGIPPTVQNPIEWFIVTKWYANPTGNMGIGRKFDASLNSGPMGGEPQGPIHVATEGNHYIIFEGAGGGWVVPEPPAQPYPLREGIGPLIYFRKANGSVRGPYGLSAALTDDIIGGIQGLAKAGTNKNDLYHAGALILFRVIEGQTTTNTAPATGIEMHTNETGQGVVERLTIRDDGAIYTNQNQTQIVNKAGDLTIPVTSTLPTPGVAENGRLVIEQDGTDYNLIYYAGNTAFRLSGT